MSERTTADDIAEAMAEARPVFADAFLADRYQLLADVEVDDGYGGRTMTEEIVEEGRCLLDVAGTQGREGGDVVLGIGPYIADLPIDTMATTDHRIRITATGTGETREFAIVGPPKRGGDFEVFTRLELELRSRP